MAQRATVYRADLTVSDLDRGVYSQHALTLARHPSETEERLMVRLLAFALLPTRRSCSGAGCRPRTRPTCGSTTPPASIVRWIDVGLPDEKDIRKACGRAREVVVLADGARRVEQWWSDNAAALSRLANLTVITLTAAETEALQCARRAVDDADVHRAGRPRVACERAHDGRDGAGAALRREQLIGARRAGERLRPLCEGASPTTSQRRRQDGAVEGGKRRRVPRMKSIA